MTINDTIIEKLNEVEQTEKVKILFAVESGSRAWGFPSADSDYDIRFVYIRPVDKYLTIEEDRDVLEYEIIDEFDVSGWDIRKSLKLFRKTNPPMIEWLNSPIVYCEPYSFKLKLLELLEEYFNPRALVHHYLSMAKSNFKGYLQSELVRAKKYFYVLRPVLAAQWVIEKKTVPPVEFERLVNTQISSVQLRNEIDRLLVSKRAGNELDQHTAIMPLNDYLESAIESIERSVEGVESGKQIQRGLLDRMFRESLNEVYK